MNILIICTGNTCRSQMAEGFLKKKYPHWNIFSAGTNAEKKVNPLAIKAMSEVEIDISLQKPEPIEIFLDKNFDYVFTVCDGANEVCPVFSGKVKNKIHKGFEDPASFIGSEEFVMPKYRTVRDQLIKYFDNLLF